ncbi:MAG: hypothetical protein E1N59_3025 [Puniceicoccaceae bacterium 5H]|nr:MAG: hypothetical protein E1N59_3025 [Puniceicoccaceae bacterium 5H]
MHAPTNLLDLPDLEAPMGDLAQHRMLSECRAIWTAPLPEEPGAPPSRIIHQRAFTPTGPARVRRIGWRNAQGYHKCGSHQLTDWIVDLRILTLDAPDASWRVLHYVRDLPRASDDAPYTWLDLEELTTYGLCLEIRRCGIDGWWTPWNLAAEAFVVEGQLEAPLASRRERLLSLGPVELAHLPRGLEAQRLDGELRFRSRWLEVGFCLSRPGLTYLALDQDGNCDTGENLLCVGPGSFHQGPMLNLVGQPPNADPAVRFSFTGRVTVKGNTIRYHLREDALDMGYELVWSVYDQHLEFRGMRTQAHAHTAWHSAAWKISLNPRVAACHLLGRLLPAGQTGAVATPAILHAPRFGSLALTQEGSGCLRMDVNRPQDRLEFEFKIGEAATPEGHWHLPAGRHQAAWHLHLTVPEFPLKSSAPLAVRAALRRAGHTGLNYRPDTATLSNNGASMHCPISMDTWSAQCVRMGPLLPGLPAHEMLRTSLERWLTGGPGYAAGNLLSPAGVHPAEDDYLMTGTAALFGLAEYLTQAAPPGWGQRFEPEIRRKLEAMLARDLDGDGLIESRNRTGTSGTGQWSTCWFDVISFGWKDAFSNAILYEALGIMLRALEPCGLEDWRSRIVDWRTLMQQAFTPTFLNPQTGWYAGWVCPEGKRHDHAFLPPNGAAVAAGLVAPAEGHTLLKRLLQEMKRVALPSPRLGLPANLWPIPDADLADIIQGYPFGYYQNGGRTHGQARHFVRGLYRAGLEIEADRLLEQLCSGLADASVFGGCKSGRDWRYWDDRPCGYEGLLTDQFGVLGVALERYGGVTRDLAGPAEPRSEPITRQS